MQGQIKAIETIYKGYRFRSRLEARWAVFFDALDIAWDYERQGFDVDGERYLPDFFIPHENLHLEIKPAPRPTFQPPVVYLAGRMVVPLKNESAQCYRPFDPFMPGAADRLTVGPVYRDFLGQRIAYAGPFTTGSGNHCGVHGDADEHEGREDKCFARALNGIRNATIVFAMLEDFEAFGTLAEIGFAHALGKRIVIGVAGEPIAALRALWSMDDDEPVPLSELCPSQRECPLWFATYMAEKLFWGERADVLASFAQWLRREYPEPREQRLMRRLGELLNEPACVVYGDPVDIAEHHENIFQLAFGTPVIRSWTHEYARFDDAARAARQARFEHGQCGAVG